MNKLFRFAMVLGLFIVCAGLAFAQDETPARPRRQQTLNSAQLLWRPDVQSDIGMTQDEKDRLDQLCKKAAKDQTSGFNQFRGTGSDQALLQFNEQVEHILTRDQRARLQEIKIQMLGKQVILDPWMQEQLHITAEQKTQIADAEDKMAQRMRGMRDRNKGHAQAPGDMIAETRKARAEYDAALAKVLTPEQNTKLKELSGRPFHRQDS